MLISYKWLSEYFDENLPPANELADIINQGAFEVEEVREQDGDFIIEVDVLPNRTHDALGYDFLAKEVSVLTGKKLAKREIKKTDGIGAGKISVNVTGDNCRRYVGREITGIKIEQSPVELREKLESIGERSINNLVDITNIVMFELNQPMHAFDSDKLDGNINVRFAKNGERLLTLDGKDVELDENDLMIADDKDALVIAGIKGGKKAEVDMATTNIFLEAANFNPKATRITSRKIAIGTESSKRFEQEISPALAEIAMNRATELILKYCATDDTKIFDIVDHYPHPVLKYRTGVSVDEINKRLGANISEEEVAKILNRFGFDYEIVNPREKILEQKEKYIGAEYKYGASVSKDSPNKFDCSSLSCYVYALCGMIIPRTSIDQYVFGEEISQSDAKPGDLVFGNSGEGEIRTETIEFLKGTPVTEGVDHVGIYLGDNKVLHASRHNQNGTEITDLEGNKSFGKIVGYRKYFNENEKRFAVTIPYERLDLKIKEDLIEEIGRIYGYNKIVDAEIPEMNFNAEINKIYTYNNIIRETLADLGFSEVMTYSFVQEGEFGPEKPMAEDKKFLRNSLISGIKKSLENNVRNADLLGLDRIKIFEIGKVFKNSAETLMLSIGVLNKQGIKKPKAEDLVKEAVEKLNEVLDLEIKYQISNIKNDEFKIITEDSGLTIVEIDLEKNYEKISDPKEIKHIQKSKAEKYRPISQYPFVTRDIAVWIPDGNSAEDLLSVIKEKSGELLTGEPRLFDEYKKDGRTSYAYRMVYQSYEKTLRDEEVNKIMDEINKEVQSRGWEVR